MDTVAGRPEPDTLRALHVLEHKPMREHASKKSRTSSSGVPSALVLAALFLPHVTSADSWVFPREFTEHGVNLRATPSISGRVVGSLFDGDALRYIEEANQDWYAVQDKRGNRAYIHQDWSVLVDPAQPEPVEIPYRCPLSSQVFDEHVRDADKSLAARVNFRFSGPQPTLFFAYLTRYLAKCAPSALGRETLKGDLETIQTRARAAHLFPPTPREVNTGHRALDDAIKHFTRINRGTLDWDSWTVPVVDFSFVDAPPTRLLLTVGVLPIGKRSAEPAELPTQEFLDGYYAEVCSKRGLADTCLDDAVVERTTVRDKTGESSVVEYYTYISERDLEVRVELPPALAASIAQFAMYNLSATFPKSMRGPDAQYAPTYSIDWVSGKPRSITRRGCPSAEFLGDSGIYNLIEDDNGRLVPHKEIRIFVVEPHATSAIDRPIPIQNYVPHAAKETHPYSTARVTHRHNEQLIVYCDARPMLDEGHALHVSHVIGGRGFIRDWTGLNHKARVSLVSSRMFQEKLLPESLRRARNRSAPVAHVFNLSYTPDDLCPGMRASDPFSEVFSGRFNPFAHSKRYRKSLNNLEREHAAELYIIAADAHEPCEHPLMEPARGEDDHYHYEEDECSQLSCSGRNRNILVVAPLDASTEGLRPETVLPGNVWMLAAPGTGILSADWDANVGSLGFGIRSGSSQATAIVSAAAAKVAARHASLTGEEIKQRLLATATRVHRPNVVGILNIRRALQSDPDSFTVWYDYRRASPKPVSGAVAEFFGNRVLDTDNIPPITRPPEQQGFSRFAIVAIIRDDPPVDRTLTPLFRALYLDRGRRLVLSAPFEITARNNGNKVDCSLAAGSGIDAVPCLRIGNERSEMRNIDLTRVTHIVFPVSNRTFEFPKDS